MVRRLPLLALAAAAGGAAVATAAHRTERQWERNPDPTDGHPLDLPEGTERTVTTRDGTELALYDMGPAAREPIVLCHGWTADRRIWGTVARRLVADGRRVVVFDQRGHGHSTVGEAGYTIDALADDLAAALEALDAHDAVLVGHSMGGMEVEAFAVIHKDVLVQRVARIVLVATAARSPLLGRPGGAYEKLALAAVASARLATLTDHERIAPWVGRQSFGRRPSMVGLRATRTSLTVAPIEMRAGFLKAMAAMDLRHDLATIPVPVTVVHGTRDQLIRPSRGREIASLVPGARLELIAGAGHQLPFEAPDRLAELIAGDTDGEGHHDRDAAGPAALFPRTPETSPERSIP